MQELTELWKKTIGPAPPDQQFAIWLAMHEPEVLRLSILKTAARNQQVGRTMSLDHLVRFASKVMLTRTQRRQEFRQQHEEYNRRSECSASQSAGGRMTEVKEENK